MVHKITVNTGNGEPLNQALAAKIIVLPFPGGQYSRHSVNKVLLTICGLEFRIGVL